MGIVRIFLVSILSCTLCLSLLPATTFAASTNTSVVKAAKKQTTSAKVSEKQAIPKNININTADKALLVQLPGIGPKTADAILSYKKANGPFKSVPELVNVKGIGEKKLAKISPYLKKV